MHLGEGEWKRNTPGIPQIVGAADGTHIPIAKRQTQGIVSFIEKVFAPSTCMLFVTLVASLILTYCMCGSLPLVGFMIPLIILFRKSLEGGWLTYSINMLCL